MTGVPRRRPGTALALVLPSVACLIAAVLQSPATAATAASHGTATSVAAAERPAAYEKAAASAHTVALGFDVPHSGAAHTQLDSVESTIKRKVAFTRDYLMWNSGFPSAYETYLGAHGTVPVVSVKARTTSGAAVPWKSIAAAATGSTLYNQMVSWAVRMKNFGHPIYFDFNHEPEAATNQGLGSSADFVAAWRRLHGIFVAQHATNVRFMWIMTSWAFRVPSTDPRSAPKWYPGDAYVDAVAGDGYNWYNCREPGTWASMSVVLSGLLAFGAAHPALTLWLTETASVEDPNVAGRKAAWINDVRTLLKEPAYSQVAGIAWFEETQPGFPKCNWPITTSASATAAMKSLAADPFFGGTAGWST